MPNVATAVVKSIAWQMLFIFVSRSGVLRLDRGIISCPLALSNVRRVLPDAPSELNRRALETSPVY